MNKKSEEIEDKKESINKKVLDDIKDSLAKKDNDSEDLESAYTKLNLIVYKNPEYEHNPELAKEILTIIKVGLEHKNNDEQSLEEAWLLPSIIGARFIDEGRYDEFNDMINMGFDPRQNIDFSWSLMDNVKTQKGAEFMVKEGLINEVYFSPIEYEKHDGYVQHDPLLNAYPEQVDFYLQHGAPPSQEAIDAMLYAGYPPEVIDRVLTIMEKDGGKYDASCNVLVSRVGKHFDSQVKRYGLHSIERTLENINVLANHGYKLDNMELAEVTATLIEKAPEFMEVFKPNIAKEDLLELKQNVMKYKLDHNDRRQLVNDKLGKTGDPITKEVTEVHKKTSKVQTDAAKMFMETKLRCRK